MSQMDSCYVMSYPDRQIMTTTTTRTTTSTAPSTTTFVRVIGQQEGGDTTTGSGSTARPRRKKRETADMEDPMTARQTSDEKYQDVVRYYLCPPEVSKATFRTSVYMFTHFSVSTSNAV